MIDRKIAERLKELGLNLKVLSVEELESRNAQDLINITKYKKNTTTPASIRASYQNQVIIRQNELISRQNEQIINQNAGLAHQNQQIINLLQESSSD